MPDIRPFRAIRYSTKVFGTDVSTLVAPPYDVLSAADKERLLKQSPQNVVEVDLPCVPPDKAGPVEVYDRAAATLRRWLSEGVLVRDEKPALYVYHQTYRHGGREYTRRKVFTVMRLEEFGRGKVFPHELTHSGPKEDRLMLMRATRCQLSPVFGLYSDPSNAVSGALDRGDRPPDMTAVLGDVVNRMWVETDAGVIDRVRRLLGGLSVYIADGHHRYTTALNYRREMAADGNGSGDEPWQYVLVCLCAMEDPGCVILPTHRIFGAIPSLPPAELIRAWSPACSFAPAAVSHADAERLIAPDAPHDIGLYVAAEDRYYAGRFTNRAILKTLAPERSEAWRSLDLAYLHRYMIEELLTQDRLGGQPPTITYTPSLADAVRVARESSGAAVLVKPTTMAQLRSVSQANDLMPQKSTYFYPKVATGLVIHPLA